MISPQPRKDFEIGILSELITLVALMNMAWKGLIKVDRIIPVGLIAHGLLKDHPTRQMVAKALDYQGIDILVVHGGKLMKIQVKTGRGGGGNGNTLVRTDLGRSNQTSTPHKCLRRVQNQLVEALSKNPWSSAAGISPLLLN